MHIKLFIQCSGVENETIGGRGARAKVTALEPTLAWTCQARTTKERGLRQPYRRIEMGMQWVAWGHPLARHRCHWRSRGVGRSE